MEWLHTFSAMLAALLVWHVVFPLVRNALSSSPGNKFLGFLTVTTCVSGMVCVVAYLVRKYTLPGLDVVDMILASVVVGVLVATIDYAVTERRLRQRRVR